MRGFRRFTAPLAALLLMAASLGAPLSTAQVFAQDYCPAGDQDHTPPDPPGSEADKAHIDLKPTDVNLRFPDTGHVVEKRGVHLVARSGGSGELDVGIRNLGNRDAPATSMKLTLQAPDGATTTKRVDVPAIKAGTTATATTTLTLQTGHHLLDVEVNPDQGPGEDCQDGRPNNDCGSVSDGCAYTYYENNKRTVGLITGGLPELHVQAIHATEPERATKSPSAESESEIQVLVENKGQTAAYNLDGHAEDAPPFVARVSVPGCDCEAKRLNLTHVPAGATRMAFTTLPLHGLTGEFTVKVQLDPDEKTADLDRPHAKSERTFALPTPNLSIHATSNHTTEGKNLLVPEGEPLVFDIHVKNHGDADAKTPSGGGVRILVERDQAGKTLLDTRRVIDAGETLTLRVTQDAQELEDEHVYRIRADPEGEVLETSKDGNDRYVVAQVARYEHAVALDADDEHEIAVPPGVDGLVAFTLTNQGTITDTYRLETQNAPGDSFYEDMQGETVSEVRLAPGEEARLQYAHRVPKNTQKGETIAAGIQIRSQGSNDVSVRNVTFVVGEDTLAPQARLQEPANGFLKNDTIVLEVTDNVAVARVETDLFGSFEVVGPDEEGSSLYTLGAAGTPDRFTLTVRAVDTAGNEDTHEFTITRDSDPPRINRFDFTPASGVRPGDPVNLIVDAYDTHIDRVEVRISQPRPNNTMYQENITLDGAGPRYLLRDWIVPERPGHYVFNVTAFDKAGNKAHEEERLYVRGLNIEIVSVQPSVVPPEPRQGDRVRLTYIVRNSSPAFETGEFLVTLVVDFRRQIGLERLNLQPGEQRAVTFHWIAEPGQHAFTMVVDQAEQVAEDDPEDESNLHFTETGILFPEQPLFAPETVRVNDFNRFGSLVVAHWYILPLLVLTLGMFAAAFMLARRNEQEKP